MQTNVNLITAAATSTGLFRSVGDDAPHEWGDDQFPNLTVWHRRLVGFEPITTNGVRWNAKWRYDIVISDLLSCGHASVENLLLRWLVAVNASTSDPWFEIVGDIGIEEGMIAQRQCIIAEVTLDMLTAYDLEIV